MSEGYLYAIELSGTEVKIGRTNNPDARLRHYRYQARYSGLHFFTESKIKNVNLAEKKVRNALHEHLSRGREYFSCDFDKAISVIKNVYEESEEYIDPSGQELKKVLLQVYVNKDIKKWLKEQAASNGRSVTAQIRHWIGLIKSGKIKVEGIGE